VRGTETAARWVRVGPTRSMVSYGVPWGGAPAVTWGNTWSHGPDPLLCKQGVVGSSPISSTALTSIVVRPAGRARSAKPALRVGCALDGLA